jgi:NhaA family Na+:H+ antiporter
MRARCSGTAPSTPSLHALDAIYDRLESPADRLLRHAGARSSYAVLPIFALANAGVTINPGVFVGHGWLMAAIVAGLAIGKPVGVFLAAAGAVRAGIAVKPAEYTSRQLAGAGALAGIGFTMSLFIAGQAFPSATDFLGRQDRCVRRVDSFGRRRDCSALGGFAPGAF